MASRAVLLVLGCFSVIGQTREPSTWTVTGIVLDSVTSQPVAGALVIWEPSFSAYGFRDRPAESAGPAANAARIVTPAAGTFTFPVDAEATGARVFVSHQGYRALDGKEAASLSVSAAASQSLTIRMVPQSVVEGSVLNAAGEPLPGVEVHAVRIEIHDGLRQPVDDSVKTTSKTGEFRFEGLPSGAYYLRTSGRYFPSADTQDRAALFEVAPGRDVLADFTLEPRLEAHFGHQIRGVIANMPLRRTVEIRLLRDGNPLSRPFQVSPNGNFQVTDVEPGQYTLQAYTPGAVPPDFGETEVVVGEGDVAGQRLTLTEGVDIPGHIDFRGAGSVETYAVVRATPLYPRRFPVDSVEILANMRPNGNFVLKNMLPGTYEIALRGLTIAYVAEVNSDSRDVLDEGLKVLTRAAPPLDIVVRPGGAEISADIAGATPGHSFSVALISKCGGVEVPTVLRALDGHFHVAGLTPGDYTLLAWPESREIEYRNPAVMSRFSAFETSVSVTEGRARSVLLTPVP